MGDCPKENMAQISSIVPHTEMNECLNILGPTFLAFQAFQIYFSAKPVMDVCLKKYPSKPRISFHLWWMLPAQPGDFLDKTCLRQTKPFVIFPVLFSHHRSLAYQYSGTVLVVTTSWLLNTIFHNAAWPGSLTGSYLPDSISIQVVHS